MQDLYHHQFDYYFLMLLYFSQSPKVTVLSDWNMVVVTTRSICHTKLCKQSSRKPQVCIVI